MLWQWIRLDETPDEGRVVRQFHEYGCGAACAAMLLADRGISTGQLVVAAGLHLPCTARELADRLNELSEGTHHWLGGHLDLEPPLGRRHLGGLGGAGSWAALLIPEGIRDGHWVVVDRILDDDTAAIRDPVGSTYRMPLAELGRLLRYMVVVFETGEHR